MPSPNNQIIWTVSALNHEVKTLLERGIGRLWLEGEISNLSKPASGHWYFSLKDQQAQIRVAMFKGKNSRVAFNPTNGQQVLVKASVSLYEARGEFQVIAEHMEEAGTGKLMREFEALKNKLKTEGLFEATFKQTIPRYPSRIGIITSPTGAAIRDALSVLNRRCPATDIIVYPCVVQGESAAQSVIKALGNALTRNECDVLLMIRGGGSIEDMWCFNDEQLAHLIYQSSIPIITGIGHEIDFTIADYVADFRAPTPSVAAESASIDNQDIQQLIDFKSAQLNNVMKAILQRSTIQLQRQQQQLITLHPKHAIDAFDHRLSLLTIRLDQSIQTILNQSQQKTERYHLKMASLNPKQSIKNLTDTTHYLKMRLRQLMQQQQQLFQQQLALQAEKLDALSPLKTLSRGYATISQANSHIQSIHQVKNNDRIKIQLKDGRLNAKIIQIESK